MVLPTESERVEENWVDSITAGKLQNLLLIRFLDSDNQKLDITLTGGQGNVTPLIEGFDPPSSLYLRAIVERLREMAGINETELTGRIEVKFNGTDIDLELTWVQAEDKDCLSVVKHPVKPGSDPTKT